MGKKDLYIDMLYYIPPYLCMMLYISIMSL